MTKTFLLQSQRQREGFIISCIVTHDCDTHDDAMKLIRQAIKDWLKNTPEGQKAWEDSVHDFNWGDFMLYAIPMPPQIIEVSDPQFGDIARVNHDEILGE
jgi:hypothetical protein